MPSFIKIKPKLVSGAHSFFLFLMKWEIKRNARRNVKKHNVNIWITLFVDSFHDRGMFICDEYYLYTYRFN